MHAEDLHARGVDRRLVTEHERPQVDRAGPPAGSVPARRRIERIAGRRGHHHVGRAAGRASSPRPPPACGAARWCSWSSPMKLWTEPMQVGKRLQVVDPLVVRAAQERREAHHLRPRAARPPRVTSWSKCSITSSNTPLRPYTPGTPERDQQPGVDQLGMVGPMGGGDASCVRPITASLLCGRAACVAFELSDAVVVHHQRRPVGVAQVAGQAELGIVAVAGDAADQHRPADDVDH